MINAYSIHDVNDQRRKCLPKRLYLKNEEIFLCIVFVIDSNLQLFSIKSDSFKVKIIHEQLYQTALLLTMPICKRDG